MPASSLKTALRDGVLIVVSILIAFALDAWWDGQKRAAEEREALVALQAELEGSRAELDSVVAFNQVQIERIDRLLDSAPGDPESLAALAGGMTFDPSLGAVEAILAGGLDRVTSIELRTAIAAWPGVLREIEVDQQILVDRFNELSDALVVEGLHEDFLQASRSNTRSTLPALRARVVGNAVVRNRLSALRTGIDGLLYELSDVETQLEDLQSLVDGILSNG